MNKIYFSSVWEDYNSLQKGLQPNKDDIVVSICSSGDNVFNFISSGVKKVYAVDINPAQLELAELKSEVIYKYDQEQAANILSGMGDKKIIIEQVAKIIENNPKKFVNIRNYNFEVGINNIGAFENKLLPVLKYFSKKYFRIHDFEKNSKIDKKLNFWIKLLPLIFSFKQTYKLLLPDFPYQYININIGKNYKRNLTDFVKYNNLSQNWYLQEAFFGKYKVYPPFLSKEKFETTKGNLNKIEFIQKDILEFLNKMEDGTVDKINLSDIFDWCSPEVYSKILEQVNRVLKKEGLVFYWELFVTREIPKNLQTKFRHLIEVSEKIHKEDNLPFYFRTIILKKL